MTRIVNFLYALVARLSIIALAFWQIWHVLAHALGLPCPW